MTPAIRDRVVELRRVQEGISAGEEWRWVSTFEGTYEASNLGRVRRSGGSYKTPFDHVISQADHACGYKAVSLYDRGRVRTRLVHRLVAEAFGGPIPPGHHVNHKDGDKTNNRLTNLEVVTRQANMDHAVATGLIDNKGERNTQAKLTAQQVASIRALYRHGGKPGYMALGLAFGVSWGTIRLIVKRRTWRHVA